MTRRLLNSATYLSMLLALASAVMWARSQWVNEAWESQPRYRWDPPWTENKTGGKARWGWARFHIAGSSAGRFVLAENEGEVFEVLTPSEKLPAAATRMTPGRGYLNPAPVLMFEQSAYGSRGRIGAVFGRFPGIEWARTAPRPPNVGGCWFLSVNWLALVSIFAFLPALRVWGRWRQSRKPAFPVVVPAADKRTGVPAVSVSQTSPSPSPPA